MATGTGIITIDFGAYPGSNEASVAVTGITTIGSGSKADVFIMGDDSTSDHTASDHRYIDNFVNFSCGTPSAGVGFTVYATSIHKISGTFKLRYVWSD